jgi:hypothetical protein
MRTVSRLVMASLLAAGLSAMWPLAAQAGKSGGGGGKSKMQNTDTQQKQPAIQAQARKKHSRELEQSGAFSFGEKQTGRAATGK